MGDFLRLFVNDKNARDVVGDTGRRKARRAHYNAIRKAITEVERLHKRRYLRPGGGAKNPQPPRDGFIMTRTGTLKKSYGRVLEPKTASGVGLSGDMFAVYGSDLKYAKYLEDGTRPTTIVATRAKALAFPVKGETAFAKWIDHPGIRARDTLGQTQRDLSPQLERTLGLSLAKEGL